jgi:membrane carboxypeptidase/penicillin-binding protein
LADRSQFNRAVQACRQPGSTYKPAYYSLSLLFSLDARRTRTGSIFCSRISSN